MNEQEREAREFKHIRENDPGFVAPRRLALLPYVTDLMK